MEDNQQIISVASNDGESVDELKYANEKLANLQLQQQQHIAELKMQLQEVSEKLTASQTLQVPQKESKLGERRNSWDEAG